MAEALEEVTHLGGFSGGGRSSGGSFGGGRSSRGSFGGSGGGYHGGPGPRPHVHFGFWGWGPRYYGPEPPPRRHDYFFTSFFTIIVLILLFSIFTSVITSSRTNSVAQNTTQRTALSGVVNKTAYYQDDIGWITSKNTLLVGLEEFYNATGVQPYILLVPYSSVYWTGSTFNTTAATNYLEEVYADTFTDEAHFIFAYFACKNDTKSEMDGEFLYLSGYSADTIMDNEAINILWGYFEINYYDTSLSIEKMFSNTFSETAESIMSSPTNGWDVLKVLLIIVAIIIIVVIIYKSLKSKNQREKEKEEYTKEILDKPLETFGKDTGDLEDKYK